MSGDGYIDPRCREQTITRPRMRYAGAPNVTIVVEHVPDCHCGKFAGILAPESTSARVARETAGAFDDLRDLLSDEAREMLEHARREEHDDRASRAASYEIATMRGGLDALARAAYAAWASDDGTTACSRERATPGDVPEGWAWPR